MTEFINIEILLSLAGCITLTTMFTEACKLYISKLINPKWYSLIFSFIFVMARQVLMIQDFTPQGWFMTFVNVIVCLLSAIGTFETAGKVLEKVVSKKINE